MHSLKDLLDREFSAGCMKVSVDAVFPAAMLTDVLKALVFVLILLCFLLSLLDTGGGNEELGYVRYPYCRDIIIDVLDEEVES
jgi:hypothetical protein